MLQRFLIHFCLLLLFAFTQISIATHEISHFSENIKQSQQDQNTHSDQCEKCIGYTNAAANGFAHTFIFDVASATIYFELGYQTDFQSASRLSYSARAPPPTQA